MFSLGHRGDVGELLLDVCQRRVGDVAVAVREHDEDGRDRECDQRELTLEEEEHDGHRQNRQDVLEEEDEPYPRKKRTPCRSTVAQTSAGRSDAGRRSEREAHEMAVEPLAHFHLDGECLLSGDQPPCRMNTAATPEADEITQT